MSDASVSIMRGRAHLIALWGQAETNIHKLERRISLGEE